MKRWVVRGKELDDGNDEEPEHKDTELERPSELVTISDEFRRTLTPAN